MHSYRAGLLMTAVLSFVIIICFLIFFLIYFLFLLVFLLVPPVRQTEFGKLLGLALGVLRARCNSVLINLIVILHRIVS